MRMFLFFGKKAKYPTLSWYENFMSGHISIKLPFKSNIVLYGENAMHWAVNWKVRGTYICFRLPFRCFGRWWSLYLYSSVDGTPSRAKWIIGNP